MTSIFQLPLDAIKDEYLYQILKSNYKSKVEFNIENQTFNFT